MNFRCGGELSSLSFLTSTRYALSVITDQLMSSKYHQFDDLSRSKATEKVMRHAKSLFCSSLLLVSLLIGSLVQAAEHPGYIDAPDRRTTGIGKFYMEREISFVMGHQAADWLNRPGRIEEERPDEVVTNMGLNSDHVVADIGAGSGYFSFRIAKLVPDGNVMAVDIQPEMLQLIEAQKRQDGVTNIQGVLGAIDDPNLPVNSIDAAIMVDAYHEFSHPFEMIRGIYEALRPGGRIFLLEYRGEDASVPIRPLHKMTEEQVVKEMSIFGLEWTDTLDFLPWQHMMIFTKT